MVLGPRAPTGQAAWHEVQKGGHPQAFQGGSIQAPHGLQTPGSGLQVHLFGTRGSLESGTLGMQK